MFPSDEVKITNKTSSFYGQTGTVINVEEHEFGTEVYVVLNGRTDDIMFSDDEVAHV